MHSKKPEIITDDILKAVNHLNTQQIGEMSMWLMGTYADRHGLTQYDIDAHKGSRERNRDDWKKAERLRLEIVIKKQQNEIDELKAALNGYL